MDPWHLRSAKPIFVPVPIPPSGTADRMPRGGGIPSGAWYKYFTGVYRGVTHPCIVLVKFSGSTYKAHWRRKVNSMSDVTVEGPFKNRIELSISPIFPWTEENEQGTHEQEIFVKIIMVMIRVVSGAKEAGWLEIRLTQLQVSLYARAEFVLGQLFGSLNL